ncbi:tetratricopeptide repeat protein [Hydrogenovibrio sp. 3SP14C1]|uniref:tetratricopeptide repeat protein n=1 Tax=Hydrogenovibrio sp. 3SP14C1 TaxID=3038774 RepID=UPI002416154D|nr:tetratricopeptide repeat protein [Hydrogenovibrio sp. 3SP14C1]MDG4812624.1 tetratricopeptide repeat protein [Hydrogenovibrio sp. 3SP14C1]
MSQPEIYNFEVSKNNFNNIVLTNSYKLPVFVLFMNPSIGTCIQMENTLSDLAEMFAGQFVFGRVDTDMEVDLREMYDIVNVPSLKVFKDGEIVHHEVGLMDLDELRVLLKNFGIFRESDDMREQARQKHIEGDTETAIQLLTEAIQKDPGNVMIAMDMIQVMLDVGLLKQATELFNRLPEKERDSETGRALVGQITFKGLANKTAGKETLIGQLEANPSDFDARFDLSICYIADHQYMEAMDQLFTILEAQPDYKDGAAQEMTVSVIQMLAPNDPEQANEFRRILGNLVA